MIYLMKNTIEDFELTKIAETEVGAGYARSVSLYGVPPPELGSDRSFILCAQCIAGGERLQRKRTEQLTKKGTRNLLTEVLLCRDYLAMRLPRIKTNKERKMDIKSAEKQLNDCLPSVKQALGWPEKNPAEAAYRVTREVVSATDDPQLRKAVEAEIPHGIILPARLALIESRWSKDYSEKSKPIIAALKQTATRDHLALISLAANRDDQPRVLIVDEAHNQLAMPAWKMLDLLEHPNKGRLLHKFSSEDQRNRYPEVVFNNESNGDLIAKYEPESSTLRVMVVAARGTTSNKTSTLSSPAIFYLDQDYLVCLLIVLKRTVSDRRRYQDLLEAAEAQVDVDPFKLQ